MRLLDKFALAGLFLTLILPGAVPASAQGRKGGEDEKIPTVAETIARLELAAHPGLLTYHSEVKRGRLWLELPPPGPGGNVGSYLFLEGVATGVGSNPIGIDRGQQGEGKVVTLRRLGSKVLLEESNTRFRALSDDPGEERAVRESFATSVLWGAPIGALDPDGRALVDLTSLLLSDAHGVAATLKGTGQGNFKLDENRSAVDLEACLAFPENLELEAVLTFVSDEPGRLARATAPTGGAITVVQHLSLVRLPDDGYTPRPFDPRAGSYAIRFQDYAAPLDASIEKRWIVRHRLEKRDPTAARSPAVRPIVYYVDPGTPEPVRSALVEGASWWAEAFAAAGFPDGFRVELLPPDAHPLDVRYNVIQWVHRATRGWSYGGGVTDPRTGERIKGHVWLGSLRVRQDRLLFEGLAGTAKTGTGTADHPVADDPVELALARIRQLAAHEVGHALGFNHNFAASTYGGRASVMDYPAPLVGITEEGDLDFSQAYGVGVGSWDIHSVRYAYSQFPAGADEAAELSRLARSGVDAGLLYLTDADARPLGSAHPRAHLWDNGDDPAEALRQALAVRRIALDRFGIGNLRPGQPLALLEEVFAPVYLYHRYQVEAAAKLVAGVDYRFALVGDGFPGSAAPVDGAWQRQGLEAVLSALDPAALDIREETLALLLPRPAEYEGPNVERFNGGTAPTFDALGAAATAADLAISPLLEPSRAARLVDQHRRNPSLPSLEEVLNRLVETAFGGPVPPAERQAEVRRTVQATVVSGMLGLARGGATTAAVRARVEARLASLADRLASAGTRDAEGAQQRSLAAEIRRHLERQEVTPIPLPPPLPPPPGSPIGSGLPDLGAADGGCSFPLHPGTLTHGG